MSRKDKERGVVSVKKRWGTAIRDQRLALGWTQRHLADKVGVDQSLISYWEQGLKAPTIEKQLMVARALGVAPRVLFQYPEVA